MLAYVLALVVGLGSIGVYSAAFFFPEIHRKNDFIWSGVGLFYALVLWVCAGRITGSVLLGQISSVALLGWSVSQTLSLRRQLTPLQQQTELPSVEKVKNTVQEKVSNLSLTTRLSQSLKRVSGSVTGAKDQIQDLSKTAQKTPPETAQPPISKAPTTALDITEPQSDADKSKVQILDNRNFTPQPADTAPNSSGDQEEDTPELIRPNPPAPELVEAAIHDAEAKDQEASPPDTESPENPSPS